MTMDALEFLKEAKRQCSSTTCEVCRNESYAVLCPLSEYPDEKLKKLVSGIEQWSKEHPVITNAKKFEEVFGSKRPHELFSCDVCNTTGDYTIEVTIQKTEWWNEPYKEPEK